MITVTDLRVWLYDALRRYHLARCNLRRASKADLRHYEAALLWRLRRDRLTQDASDFDLMVLDKLEGRRNDVRV